MTFELFFLSVAFISRQLSVKVTTWRTSFCFGFFKILIALCFVEITKWWTGFHWKMWKCILPKVENKTILLFLLTLNVNIYGLCVCVLGGGGGVRDWSWRVIFLNALSDLLAHESTPLVYYFLSGFDWLKTCGIHSIIKSAPKMNAWSQVWY